MEASGCLPGSDGLPGPRVDTSCRSFDFTLLFEDAYLGCVPAAVLLFLLPSHVLWLWRQRPVGGQACWFRLLAGKAAALLAVASSQTAFAILRSRNPTFKTTASTAADVLSLVATLGALGLSYLDHQRSLRPSTLLCLYLTVVIILGVARVRTLWLIDSGAAEPAIATASLSLTVIVLLLESVEKKSSLRPGEKTGAPEEYSGFWNRSVFVWLAATLRVGYSKVISVQDLPPLDTKLESRLLRAQLVATWSKYDHRGKHGLLRASFRAFSRSFLAGVIPRVCLTAFKFSQPFLISTTVELVGKPNANSHYGRGLIGAWAFVFLGIAASTSVTKYQTTRFVARIRGSLIGLIYEKDVALRAVDSRDITAVALMGTDVERISASFIVVHETWATFLEVSIAIWLLERQLAIACVAPVALSLVCMATMFSLLNAVKQSQVVWIERVQERLRATSSMLGDMKVIKMLGLAPVMSVVIRNLRQTEITSSERYRKLLVVELVLSNGLVNLAPVVTFAVYAITSIYWKEGSLLTAQAFTSITVIEQLTLSVLLCIQTFPTMVQCVGSFSRIQEFCNYTASDADQNDRRPNRHEVTSEISLQPLGREGEAYRASQLGLQHKDAIVLLEGQDFAWERGKQPVLKQMATRIERGRITVLVGPVGSGKTTLLESIMGETLATRPVIRDGFGSTAYCSQQPWLENVTIRANIIGVTPYEKTWYNQVTASCGLSRDLENLDAGDRTKIGSKGLNLSGGQKQRIALARAVYSRPNMVLLDDVFSGMDVPTTETVSQRLLGAHGYFRRTHTTVVLATHNHNLMALADSIIALEGGRVVEAGSPQSLMRHEGYVSRLGLQLDAPAPEPPSHGEPAGLQPVDSQASARATEHAQEPLQDDPRRKNGDFSVYKYYFHSAGYGPVAGFVASILAWVFLSEFPTIWLKWWSEANAAEPNRDVGIYTGVLVGLGVAGTLAICLTCWTSFMVIISRSAHNIHSDLLSSALLAPLRLYTSTDTGSLTNRFSQDMELIDMALPMVMVNYSASISTLVAKGIILVVFSRYLAAAVPVIGAAVYSLQRFYLQTSRQVRLLEIEAKAPLYNHFIETRAGAATIRAFGWQRHYQDRSHRLIDTYQRPVYLQQCIQHWLGVVMNSLVAAIAVVLVGIVVAWTDKFDAGSVGVSLVMVVTFSGELTRVILTWTLMESSIGAVARVRQFVAETEHEESGGKEMIVPICWPPDGRLEFRDLEASHGPGSPPVLKGLTISIQPREHVAICGRSGSGKTSLILCLLGMMEKSGGSIVVDGLDIASLSCSDVRSRLNVVPQDPFLMPGTVRFNMDPFKAATDADIAGALRRVRLWDVVSDQGGLDRDMNTEAWSAGQRQLLCLARAMVRKSSILILDEATSSVDEATEAIMQDIIDTEFRNCTVLAVMHRLKHVAKYDKVALLDGGLVAEFDAPAVLLAGDTSFAQFCKSSAH